MYSPLTTIPRRTRPCRIMSLRMKTPVIIPAQAFEMSKLSAFGAPSAAFSDTLNGGSSCIRRPPT